MHIKEISSEEEDFIHFVETGTRGGLLRKKKAMNKRVIENTENFFIS